MSGSTPATTDPAGTQRAHDAGILLAIEQAMIHIRRRQSRRALSTQLVADSGAGLDVQQLAVVDAVEEGPGPDAGGVTVGMIAERMGIDPSRASRVVATAIRSGLVLRVASQADGRRVCIELTLRGRQIADAAHQRRQAYYAKLMNDWPARDRAEFARLLGEFAGALVRSDAAGDGGEPKPA